MEEILINKFNGSDISTFYWKDKICFLPIEITNVLGYANGAKTIQDCIKKEFFEEGEDYFILRGLELKNFKNNCTEALVKLLKKVARLLIITETGLYGFLQYSHKKEAIGFKKWIRSDVLPSIRRNGYYSLKKESEIKNREIYDNRRGIYENRDEEEYVDSALEKFKIANETFKMIEKILDNEEEERKLPILNSVYKSMGIDLELNGFNEIFLDISEIAIELGIYDEEENPNCEAVEEILRRIHIIENEKRYTYKKCSDYNKVKVKYSRVILDKIIDWVVENEKPILLSSKEKNIVIIYK